MLHIFVNWGKLSMLYNTSPQLIDRLYKFILRSTIFVSSLILLFSYSVNLFALSSSFDQNAVLYDQDLYSIPLAFSSKEKIQSYLQARGSVLANLKVNISFESDADIINPDLFKSSPDRLSPPKIIAPLQNTQMSVAELIWNLSQTSLSSGCSLVYQDICVDTEANPINPVFLLTLIQKESGLVYGQNSKIDPNSDSGKFLLDRAVGYYCFEGARENSCYDNNPDWKYYKGFFRQLYYASRVLRINEERCKLGGRYAFQNNSGIYQVGNSVKIDSQTVQLRNGITCSLYIYTPHIYNSQYNVWFIMREMGADKDVIRQNGLDPNYTPSLFRPQ